jgi:hypothetical protein
MLEGGTFEAVSPLRVDDKLHKMANRQVEIVDLEDADTSDEEWTDASASGGQLWGEVGQTRPELRLGDEFLRRPPHMKDPFGEQRRVNRRKNTNWGNCRNWTLAESFMEDGLAVGMRAQRNWKAAARRYKGFTGVIHGMNVMNSKGFADDSDNSDEDGEAGKAAEDEMNSYISFDPAILTHEVELTDIEDAGTASSSHEVHWRGPPRRSAVTPVFMGFKQWDPSENAEHRLFPHRQGPLAMNGGRGSGLLTGRPSSARPQSARPRSARPASAQARARRLQDRQERAAVHGTIGRMGGLTTSLPPSKHPVLLSRTSDSAENSQWGLSLRNSEAFDNRGMKRLDITAGLW